MHRLAIGGALAFALASSTSCTLVWWLNQDPEGLPCDFSVDPKGACLEGYVCITVDEGQDTQKHQVCLKAGIKKKNDPCAKTEECGQDLVCGTGYDGCGANANDINCEIASDADKKLACRTACNPAKPEATCNAGERCFENKFGNFCQTGTCASDTDCGKTEHPSTCHDIELTAGASGVCQEVCDPLACDPASGTCPDCIGADGIQDVGVNCIEPIDVVQVSAPVCESQGPTLVPFFQPCREALDQCATGSFCNIFLPAGSQTVCTPWCDTGGGNPVCDNDDSGNPRQCIALVAPNAGYCAP